MEPSYNFDTKWCEEDGRGLDINAYYAKQQKEEDAKYFWYDAATRNAEQYTGFVAVMMDNLHQVRVSVGELSLDNLMGFSDEGGI